MRNIAGIGLLVLAPLVFAPTPTAQVDPVGRVEEGKAAWNVPFRCASCHGAEGQGGYGPDLATRGITFDAFRRAVRDPWGVMPSWTERQVSDQTLADMYAYLNSLPRPSAPGKPPYTAPADAPIGQVYMIETGGCASCHGPELTFPRQVLGGQEGDHVDYALFEKIVYDHTAIYPQGRMGSYSRHRLPPPILQEIYRFVRNDLGLLVPMNAAMRAGVAAGDNTTYALVLRNTGAKGKGLAAGDITVTVMLPADAKVVATDGPGYQGVQANVRGDHDTTGRAAVWKVEQLAAGDQVTFSVTLAGPPQPPNQLFKDSMVGWTKPVIRPGVRNLALRDYRGQRDDDFRAVTFPR